MYVGFFFSFFFSSSFRFEQSVRLASRALHLPRESRFVWTEEHMCGWSFGLGALSASASEASVLLLLLSLRMCIICACVVIYQL